MASVRMHPANGMVNVERFYEAINLDKELCWPGKNLRISVTGAGGFIASHIAEGLKSEGHSVVSSDWKTNEHMPEEMFCNEFHLVDLRVLENCSLVTKGPEHVFNLAADMGASPTGGLKRLHETSLSLSDFFTGSNKSQTRPCIAIINSN